MRQTRALQVSIRMFLEKRFYCYVLILIFPAATSIIKSPVSALSTQLAVQGIESVGLDTDVISLCKSIKKCRENHCNTLVTPNTMGLIKLTKKQRTNLSRQTLPAVRSEEGTSNNVLQSATNILDLHNFEDTVSADIFIIRGAGHENTWGNTTLPQLFEFKKPYIMAEKIFTCQNVSDGD